MNVCRFPGVYKTKESKKTLRLWFKQNSQNFSEYQYLTSQVVTPDAVRMFLEKSYVKFPKKFLEKLKPYFLENPAKYHYDPIQAFDSNNY